MAHPRDDFEQWSREDQVEYLVNAYQRRGLIERVLRLSGVELTEMENTDNLTKSQLAQVYLALKDVPSGDEQGV